MTDSSRSRKKLLAAGCSFTKDYHHSVWPDYLAEHLNHELINIGARGAGIQFIQKRIIYSCSEFKPDLVVIMLTSADRFDWYIDEHHPLKNHALELSSWQNGQQPYLVDVDGSLSVRQGYSLSGGHIRDHKKHWYKYYHNESFVLIDYWTCVLCIQSYLQARNIPYVFTASFDLNDLIDQSYNRTGYNVSLDFLKNQIDFTKFALYNHTQGLLDFSKNRFFDFNRHYPESAAHLAYVDDILYPFIMETLKYE